MTLAERFWSKVDQRGPDECWPWTAAVSGGRHGGYGYLRVGEKVVPAHRLALLLTGVDPGATTRHTCDNPPCCNPAHLLPGTQGDNMRDMAVRGRCPRKLTLEHVLEIRARLAAGESNSSVARDVGVSGVHIGNIKHGTRWAHVA